MPSPLMGSPASAPTLGRAHASPNSTAANRNRCLPKATCPSFIMPLIGCLQPMPVGRGKRVYEIFQVRHVVDTGVASFPNAK
eukprot:2543088-Pyramimonas_sp.AAC.1